MCGRLFGAAWLTLSLFTGTCYGTSIVYVISNDGQYVVFAADSRNVDPSNNITNNEACKVITLGNDTTFYESGTAVVGDRQGHLLWSSQRAARQVYTANKNHDARTLAIAWGKVAFAWFDRQSDSDQKLWTKSESRVLANGAFINYDQNRNPVVFSEPLSYDAQTKKLSLPEPITSSRAGLVGRGGDYQELVAEFMNAETPRAQRAYGTLKVRYAGNELGYDIQFVQKAIQFVIDNAPDKRFVHSPIDVVVLRRFGGADWVVRKHNCYIEDTQPSHK